MNAEVVCSAVNGDRGVWLRADTTRAISRTMPISEIAVAIGTAPPRFDALSVSEAELLPADSVGYVYCAGLEALANTDIQRVLAAAVRILRPMGVVRVATQDLDAIVYRYLLGPQTALSSGATRAQQLNEWRKNEIAQFIFNEDDLRAELSRAGFVDLWRLPAGASSIDIFLDCEAQDSDALVLEGRKPAR